MQPRIETEHRTTPSVFDKEHRASDGDEALLIDRWLENE